MNITWTTAEDDYIQRHYATDSDGEIGQAINRKAEAVCKRRSLLGFLRSRLPKDSPALKRLEDPTPEEIAALCDKIRRKWTEQDFYNRARYAGSPPVETSEFRVKAKANGQIVIGKEIK